MALLTLLRGSTAYSFHLPSLFMEDASGADPGRAEDGETIGLRVAAGGRALFFIPGCAAMPPDLAARLEGADTRGDEHTSGNEPLALISGDIKVAFGAQLNR
jgi:hypothetical protein